MNNYRFWPQVFSTQKTIHPLLVVENWVFFKSHETTR